MAHLQLHTLRELPAPLAIARYGRSVAAQCGLLIMEAMQRDVKTRIAFWHWKVRELPVLRWVVYTLTCCSVDVDVLSHDVAWRAHPSMATPSCAASTAPQRLATSLHSAAGLHKLVRVCTPCCCCSGTRRARSQAPSSCHAHPSGECKLCCASEARRRDNSVCLLCHQVCKSKLVRLALQRRRQFISRQRQLHHAARLAELLRRGTGATVRGSLSNQDYAAIMMQRLYRRYCVNPPQRVVV